MSKSKLILPKEPEPDRSQFDYHVFTCRYPRDLKRFLELLEESKADLISVTRSGGCGITLDGLGGFAIVYKFDKELSMEVWI